MPSTGQRLSCDLSLRWILGVVGAFLAFASGPARATPTVESIQFLSGVQSNDNTCDLKYRILIRGDHRSYRSASFAVTTSVATLAMLNGTVSVPEIDSEQVMLTAPFSVRYNVSAFRKQKIKISNWCPEPDDDVGKGTSVPPLSATNFAFQFTGLMVGISPTAGTLRVGELAFLEGGGRPGHEGTFPIQGDSPPAGAEVTLSVDIFGGASSVAYQLLSATSVVLNGTSLTASSSNAWEKNFSGAIVVPSQPFRIGLTATNPNGQTLTWQSRLYSPAPLAVRIVPTTAIVKVGQTVPVTLQIASDSIVGRYTVTMYPPPQFTVAPGSMKTSVIAKTITSLKTSLVVGPSATQYTRYPLLVEAIPTNPALPSISAVLDFEVE